MVKVKYEIKKTKLGRTSTIEDWETTLPDCVAKADRLADELGAYIELYVETLCIYRTLPKEAGLRWARVEWAALSRDELAKRCNVTEKTIANWENHPRRKSVMNKRRALMEALGFPWELHTRLFGDIL